MRNQRSVGALEEKHLPLEGLQRFVVVQVIVFGHHINVQIANACKEAFCRRLREHYKQKALDTNGGARPQRMSKNKLITREEVEAILNRDAMVGDGGSWLRIRSLELYQQAFVHKSFVIKGESLGGYAPKETNDVFEWAGDKCLGFCVAAYLTRRFPLGNACFLTNAFKSLIRGSALHRFARYHNFGRYILFAPRIEHGVAHRGLGHINIYEDAFEAFLEAVVRDFGVDDGARYVRRFLIATIEKCMDFSQLLGTSDNHKQAVQRAFQLHKFAGPVYVDVPGPRNYYVKIITVPFKGLQELPEPLQQRILSYGKKARVALSRWTDPSVETADDIIVGLGRGTKKAIAEQNCSKTALAVLDQDTDVC